MGVKEIAAKMQASKASAGGNNINPGRGLLMVKALKTGGKPEFYAGDTFVAELQVIENEPFVGLLNEKNEVKRSGNQVGSSAAFVQQFDEYPETAFPNTKSFILELMGEPEDTPDFAQAYEALCDRKTNPARGMLIRYSTYESKPTKKSGKILTLIRWEHVKQTVEEIAARRAQLDGAEPAPK